MSNELGLTSQRHSGPVQLAQVCATQYGARLWVIGDVSQAGCQPLQTQAFCPGSNLPYPFDTERIQRSESSFGQGEQTVIHFIQEAVDRGTEGGCRLSLFLLFEAGLFFAADRA